MHTIFDHLVYAAPDLDAAVAHVYALTGVRADFGGQHESLGTHNALLGLGDGRYLEVLAPVPGHADASPFAALLAGLEAPCNLMWAVRTHDIDAFVAHAQARGYDPGGVVAMSRALPGGPTLGWRVTLGGADVIGGVLPFGIQWDTGGHPTDTAPDGCTLRDFHAEHPDAAAMRTWLTALRVDVRVDDGPTPALVATLNTPKGPVTFR